MKKFNFIEGRKAESKAKIYLEKKGYKILAVNYMTNLGEIDIISKLGNKIVFIEVKGRSSCLYGLPREAVTQFKQKKIKRVAEIFLVKNKLIDMDCQFDVIEILDGEISHIENCF